MASWRSLVSRATGHQSLGVSDTPFTEFALKGRCKRCWGALRGRTDPAGAVTGIRCIVCGKLLEGSAVAAEEKRISEESYVNAFNMRWGHQPKYGDGPFAQKVFPSSTFPFLYPPSGIGRCGC